MAHPRGERIRTCAVCEIKREIVPLSGRQKEGPLVFWLDDGTPNGSWLCEICDSRGRIFAAMQAKQALEEEEVKG